MSVQNTRVLKLTDANAAFGAWRGNVRNTFYYLLYEMHRNDHIPFSDPLFVAWPHSISPPTPFDFKPIDVFEVVYLCASLAGLYQAGQYPGFYSITGANEKPKFWPLPSDINLDFLHRCLAQSKARADGTWTGAEQNRMLIRIPHR